MYTTGIADITANLCYELDVIHLVHCGNCPACHTPTVYPSFTGTAQAPTPIKLCNCKRTKKRKSFEKEMRVCHASADVTGEDATEVVLLLGTLLGRAQAAILSGNRESLRKHLIQLTALGWKLGDEL